MLEQLKNKSLLVLTVEMRCTDARCIPSAGDRVLVLLVYTSRHMKFFLPLQGAGMECQRAQTSWVFAITTPGLRKLFIHIKKIHTHNGYKILLKLKHVRLTGTHGSSMIKNIPLHIGCTCANVSLNVKQ